MIFTNLGERASVVKRADNLKPEGDFIKRDDGTWVPGERAEIVFPVRP